MSTKIYNAFRLRGADMSQLLDDLSVLKKRYHDRIVKNLTNFIKANKCKVSSIRFDELERSLAEAADSNTNIELNFVASVVVFPFKKRVYIQFFGVNELPPPYAERVQGDTSLFDGLQSFEDMEDFHYQNQTDKPDEVSNYQWNHRREIWDKMFQKRGDRPCDMGFVYEIFTSSDARGLSIDIAMELRKEKETVEFITDNKSGRLL